MEQLKQRVWGIEINLDILILILLWYLNYKLAFLIFLVLFLTNALMVARNMGSD